MVLLFKPEHVEPILCGEKTQMRMVLKHLHARVGAICTAKTEVSSRDYFARLKVTRVRHERLGDISEADARAEGGYTIEAYRRKWIEISGAWDPEQLVWVVDFEVLRRSG